MCRTRMKTLTEKPSKHHRLSYMSASQLKEKYVNSYKEAKATKRKLESYNDKITDDCSEIGVKLESNMSTSFIQIMKDNATSALGQFKDGSIQQLLWQQQFEAAQKANNKQMRWHPVILRWCIALHAKSPAAYRMIKKSQVLELPHETTLRDYTKFTNARGGWNREVIKRVKKDYNIDIEPLKRNVSLLFDEVKVKSGLVYSTENGRLIGFCDLGSLNNDIQSFSGNKSESGNRDVATHILTFMIRGIFCKLECVVAHYPCKGFSSEQLFNSVWEGISELELAGIVVRALVCDGATPNRKFFKLHGDTNDLCHVTANSFALSRQMYFISDVPHLMKTTRNNFENSGWNNKTRNMYFNGLPIKWNQIVRLVEQDIHDVTLRLLPRITHEHLHLTPTLRMRVRLAVQVLSSSMAKAIQRQGRPELSSTETFIKMFDQFFDCLNVSNISKATRVRKPACAPYTSHQDWRFKWLESDFLGFLNQWEQEANQQVNLTTKERRQLCLSRETLEGLRITVKSFVMLGKELLQLPNVKFLLSDKFNQDPLEEYFSKQRGIGGFNDNPTVYQFQHNALKLQVSNSPSVLASTRGNCQIGEAGPMNVMPLQRRKNKSR